MYVRWFCVLYALAIDDDDGHHEDIVEGGGWHLCIVCHRGMIAILKGWSKVIVLAGIAPV